VGDVGGWVFPVIWWHDLGLDVGVLGEQVEEVRVAPGMAAWSCLIPTAVPMMPDRARDWVMMPLMAGRRHPNGLGPHDYA
jgi:hypothetical protein